MQAPSAVVMIRPHHFTPNQETAADNVFQKASTVPLATLHERALQEVCNAITELENAGVKVYPFDDKGTSTPDSVFPNNWFSTHDCGTVVTYPMYCQNRRLEVNPAILERLAQDYEIKRALDYTAFAERGQFLEGTGAMVLDHQNKIAYAVRSKRMDEKLLNSFCQELGFTPCVFSAFDNNNVPVYHTNVLMCVASEFVMVGVDMIKDSKEKQLVEETIAASGKKLIPLTSEQISHFAGNALEVNTANGRVLVMSSSAHKALTAQQLGTIKQFVGIVVVTIPTIELAGGSIRCMLAGVHLLPKVH